MNQLHSNQWKWTDFKGLFVKLSASKENRTQYEKKVPRASAMIIQVVGKDSICFVNVFEYGVVWNHGSGSVS